MRIEHWVVTLRLRLRSLFQRNRLHVELDEELRDHSDRQIEENLACGMSAEEARLAARRPWEMPQPYVTRRTTHGAGAEWNCCFAMCG